jgi:hypothetical protein
VGAIESFPAAATKVPARATIGLRSNIPDCHISIIKIAIQGLVPGEYL